MMEEGQSTLKIHGEYLCLLLETTHKRLDMFMCRTYSCQAAKTLEVKPLRDIWLFIRKIKLLDGEMSQLVTTFE